MHAPRGTIVVLLAVAFASGGLHERRGLTQESPSSTVLAPRPPSSLLWPSPPPPPSQLSSQLASAPVGNLSPFSVKLAVDLPIIAVAGGLALGTQLINGELPGPFCGVYCDRQDLNALDRTVVGNRSPGAATASDVLMGLQMALPFALDFVDVLVNKPADRFLGYGQDVLVLSEVLVVNVALNNIVKLAVRRPRPYVYDLEEPVADRTEPKAALSFYSEHTSTAFAMATAYSYLFMKRHPGSKLVAPVWVLTESLAALTAYLRVYAGKHFYTDVLTGALVGSAIGLLIPVLHRRIVPPAALPQLAGMHLSVVPTASSDGGGLLVSLY